jgi:RNA polymerase sigma factor (sigma-70 family)
LRNATSKPLTNAQRDRVAANVGLIYAMLNLMKVPEQNRDDAVEAGEDSLMRAARSFKADRGIKFSTYACTAIRRGLYREYSKRMTREGRQRNMTDIGSEDYTPLYTEGVMDPEAEYDPETFELMRQCLGRLDPRTRDIVRRRYGIGCDAERLADIGTRWKLTRSRVQQLAADGGAVMAKIMGRAPGSEPDARPRPKTPPLPPLPLGATRIVSRFRPGRRPRGIAR